MSGFIQTLQARTPSTIIMLLALNYAKKLFSSIKEQFERHKWKAVTPRQQSYVLSIPHFRQSLLLHKSTPIHEGAQCYNYSWIYSFSSHSESITILLVALCHSEGVLMQLAKMEVVGWTEEMPNIHQRIELCFYASASQPNVFQISF